MQNSNSIFDIFDYLGICVTDNLETVQKALDDLPANKMADLRKKPAFSQLRRLLYSKRATPDFLSYVQEIREQRQSNQQNYNQQNYNQRQSNQQNYNQRNYNQRNYNQQNYNQQNYNQQDYNNNDIDFVDDGNLPLKKEGKYDGLLGCAFIIFVGFCILGGIVKLIDSSVSITLSNPKVKFNDVDRQSVRISWEPVEHADYYLLKNKSDDLPETEIRKNTEYIVFRHDDRKTEYSLTACSDDEKYKPSSSVKINIESVKSHLQESENETEEEPENVPEDNYTPSVLTPEPLDDKPSKSVKTVLDAPKTRIVETKNSVLLLWDDVENADRYLLEIKMGRNGKSFSKVVNDSMYTFTTLKPNKEYFITVTAIPKDETRFSPSPSKTISYTLQPK